MQTDICRVQHRVCWVAAVCDRWLVCIRSCAYDLLCPLLIETPERSYMQVCVHRHTNECIPPYWAHMTVMNWCLLVCECVLTTSLLYNTSRMLLSSWQQASSSSCCSKWSFSWSVISGRRISLQSANTNTHNYVYAHAENDCGSGLIKTCTHAGRNITFIVTVG